MPECVMRMEEVPEVNEDGRCSVCDDRFWEGYADSQYDDVDFDED